MTRSRASLPMTRRWKAATSGVARRPGAPAGPGWLKRPGDLGGPGSAVGRLPASSPARHSPGGRCCRPSQAVIRRAGLRTSPCVCSRRHSARSTSCRQALLHGRHRVPCSAARVRAAAARSPIGFCLRDLPGAFRFSSNCTIWIHVERADLRGTAGVRPRMPWLAEAACVARPLRRAPARAATRAYRAGWRGAATRRPRPGRVAARYGSAQRVPPRAATGTSCQPRTATPPPRRSGLRRAVGAAARADDGVPTPGRLLDRASRDSRACGGLRSRMPCWPMSEGQSRGSSWLSGWSHLLGVLFTVTGRTMHSGSRWCTS
jgi:hypothetical protein